MEKFLESSVHISNVPCFCQYVTNEVFKELIKLEFPVPNEKNTLTVHSMTQIERNALRYVAGYIKKHYKRRKHFAKNYVLMNK